jgi:aspartate/methionine/tyrosine aminotransferase
VQQAGLAAIAGGEAPIRAFVDELRLRRDALVAALEDIPGITLGVPDGAMYVFFKVEGEPDSLAFAKRLAGEGGLGLAPGSAFGEEGEGCLRWCFARPVDQLREGVRRLRATLGR